MSFRIQKFGELVSFVPGVAKMEELLGVIGRHIDFTTDMHPNSTPLYDTLSIIALVSNDRPGEFDVKVNIELREEVDDLKEVLEIVAGIRPPAPAVDDSIYYDPFDRKRK